MDGSISDATPRTSDPFCRCRMVDSDRGSAALEVDEGDADADAVKRAGRGLQTSRGLRCGVREETREEEAEGEHRMIGMGETKARGA